MAMRKLLWLVNAHPTLISHRQVFQHLQAHFESATFHPGNLAWAAGAWSQEVPAWIRLCSWVGTKGAKLCRPPAMELFDKKIKGAHPHLGHGVERHAVVASLWSRHQASSSYPPLPNTDSLASMRYFELQGHLLASYIEARFRLSSLEFYETYIDKLERPIAPGRTQEVGVAIREFSLAKYAAVANQLPTGESTPVFASEFAKLKVSLLDLPGNTQDDAVRYLISLRRFFDRFQRMLGGWNPPQTNKLGGGGGGGGRARRHGFVFFDGPSGVYMQEPAEANPDPDILCVIGQAVLIDLDLATTKKQKATESTALEASGLSPAETLEEVFLLFSPAEIKGRLFAAHYRRLAAEASAQAFAFDYQQLTPNEVSEIYKRAGEWIACQNNDVPDNPQARQQHVAGLLARTMLLLGQPLDRAWSIDCIWQMDSLSTLPVCTKLTLLISAPAVGDWDNARVQGFCLPAIMPSFKLELNQNLSEIDGDSADAFLLPDHFGLGQQLFDHLKTESRTTIDGFGMKLESANKALLGFTASFGDPRITQQKISRFLSALVTAQTGDQSLSWVLTADSQKSDQPRMHYTRHPVTRLQDAYFTAAKRIQKMTGNPLHRLSSPKGTSAQIDVGTRFVMSLPEVEKMLSGMISDLKEPLAPEPTQDEFRRYHNLFVIYTALFQALETSIRSVIGPNQLFQAWVRSRSDYGLVCVGLSDKDSRYTERARAVVIREPLATQFELFQRHLSCLHHHLKICGPMLKAHLAQRPFAIVAPNGDLLDLTPAIFEIALNKYTACDLPSNFHRSFLRTELLRRSCPAELIDSHHGHSNFGEASHSRASSFDYRLHFERIGTFLQRIHDDIGLKPVSSHLGYQRLRGRPS